MEQLMLNPTTLLEFAKRSGRITTNEVVGRYGVSRQFAHRILASLVADLQLIKIGRTRRAWYATPEFVRTHPSAIPNRFEGTFVSNRLEEHVVLDRVESSLRSFDQLPENVQSLFRYAFSEMLNNAIEHARSKRIGVTATLDRTLRFVIEDFGVGVFRSVQRQRQLASPLEAIQDLLKGKTTTVPSAHSGEGIFFTSKAVDRFELLSYGYELIVDTTGSDVFVRSNAARKRGTRVSVAIDVRSPRHLKAVFDEYANLTDGEYGFDRTDILVRLYTLGDVHVSRSQARRILAGLDQFKLITLDFERVPMIGQAFADEIYRVFAARHPGIAISETNMNEAVRFMVERAKTEARRRPPRS